LQLNPNSYNLKLHDCLMIYKNGVLDPKKENPTEEIIIPKEGLLLEPGQLYLARTCEYTETHGFVPILQGRSSIGRLGVAVHITSGFGDIGFCGYWTMQLSCIKKTMIYPNMKICQIYYQNVLGDYDDYCSEKYQNSHTIQASKIYKEMIDNKL